MIWLGIGIFYWVVCGFVAAAQGHKKDEPLWITAFCFAMGGFLVPALIIKKVIA